MIHTNLNCKAKKGASIKEVPFSHAYRAYPRLTCFSCSFVCVHPVPNVSVVDKDRTTIRADRCRDRSHSADAEGICPVSQVSRNQNCQPNL